MLLVVCIEFYWQVLNHYGWYIAGSPPSGDNHGLCEHPFGESWRGFVSSCPPLREIMFFVEHRTQTQLNSFVTSSFSQMASNAYFKVLYSTSNWMTFVNLECVWLSLQRTFPAVTTCFPHVLYIFMSCIFWGSRETVEVQPENFDRGISVRLAGKLFRVDRGFSVRLARKSFLILVSLWGLPENSSLLIVGSLWG